MTYILRHTGAVMGKPSVKPELMRQGDAAHFLQRSPWTLRYWRRHGYGPAFFRIGRIIMYQHSDLEDFLVRSRVVPSAAQEQRVGAG